jgi:hypothetical protein
MASTLPIGRTPARSIHCVVELHARDAEDLADSLADELVGERVAAGQSQADGEPAGTRSASSTLRNSVFARCCRLIGRYSARSGDSS